MVKKLPLIIALIILAFIVTEVFISLNARVPIIPESPTVTNPSIQSAPVTSPVIPPVEGNITCPHTKCNSI